MMTKSLLLILCVMATSMAQASFLRMVSRLEGSEYYLKNEGDEASKSVRPFIQVGNFSKEFDSYDLSAGQEGEWDLPLNEMQKGLPRGKSVMAVTIRYQDLNGYPFSVPEVRDLVSKDLSAAEQKVLGIPMIRVSLTVEPRHNQEFRVRYRVENLKDEKISVKTKLWIPEEFDQLTSPVTLEIKPKQTVDGSFEIRNKKALEGSFYNLIGTFEYDHDGIHDFQSVFGGVNVTKEDTKPVFNFSFKELNLNINWWMILGSIFVLGYLVLYRTVIRPLKK